MHGQAALLSPYYGFALLVTMIRSRRIIVNRFRKSHSEDLLQSENRVRFNTVDEVTTFLRAVKDASKHFIT